MVQESGDAHMTDGAPKRIWAWITGIQPLQGNAGLWRSDEWTITDDEYILAAEHDRIVAEKDAEIARLREALRPFSEALSVYRNFSEHQLILLSEDNPKGRRLAHLLPEQFAVARAALKGDDNG